MLASRILGIGKEILKASSRVSADGLVPPADAKRAQDAVKWIQRAFTLIEKMEDADGAGVVDLKVCASCKSDPFDRLWCPFSSI